MYLNIFPRNLLYILFCIHNLYIYRLIFLKKVFLLRSGALPLLIFFYLFLIFLFMFLIIQSYCILMFLFSKMKVIFLKAGKYTLIYNHIYITCIYLMFCITLTLYVLLVVSVLLFIIIYLLLLLMFLMMLLLLILIVFLHLLLSLTLLV